MVKHIKIIAVLLCIFILSGCNKAKPAIEDSGASKTIPPVAEVDNKPEVEDTKITLPDLGTESGIKEYLQGEWTYKPDYMGSMYAKMNIDKDLNVELSLYECEENVLKYEYVGKIKIDRLYADGDEPPDIITLELNDDEYSEGDFFFLHRTNYDDKRVMSWFYAGNGNHVFENLIDDGAEYWISELIFEKVTGEKTQQEIRKADYFYAVFWGAGPDYEGVWIDDVWWTPPEDDDYAAVYPRAMTMYEDNIFESTYYKISPDKDFPILGDGLFEGEVYYIETDDKGNIIEIMDAFYKDYLDSSEIGPEIEDMIFDIIYNDIVEMQEYLDAGMSIWFDGEMITIDDDPDFYSVILGTDHPDHFAREIFYAINPYSRAVYRLDILTGDWEVVGAG